MKNSKKNENVRKEAEKRVHMDHSTSFPAPSKEVVEGATEYVADNFGRALTRLSDR